MCVCVCKLPRGAYVPTEFLQTLFQNLTSLKHYNLVKNDTLHAASIHYTLYTLYIIYTCSAARSVQSHKHIAHTYDSGNRDWWPVYLAHVEPLENDFIEGRIGASSQEPVQLYI